MYRELKIKLKPIQRLFRKNINNLKPKQMTAKEKLFNTMDRIDELKKLPVEIISEEEELELRNLEVKMMQYYSDWKDC